MPGACWVIWNVERRALRPGHARISEFAAFLQGLLQAAVVLFFGLAFAVAFLRVTTADAARPIGIATGHATTGTPHRGPAKKGSDSDSEESHTEYTESQ